MALLALVLAPLQGFDATQSTALRATPVALVAAPAQLLAAKPAPTEARGRMPPGLPPEPVSLAPHLPAVSRAHRETVAMVRVAALPQGWQARAPPSRATASLT